MIRRLEDLSRFKNRSIRKQKSSILQWQSEDKDKDVTVYPIMPKDPGSLISYDSNVALMLRRLIDEIELTKVAIFKPSGKLGIYTMSMCPENLALVRLEEAIVEN